MASTVKGRRAKLVRRAYSPKDIEKVVMNTPEEVVITYRELLAKFNEGLPRATSGEVLNSRVKW